jgi:S-adenosylmethionine/arginine decarboxylase-like enzyme
MSKFWGYHLVLDCAGCSLIDDKSNIERFVADTILSIGMVVHGEPQIEYLLDGTDNEGYSVLQMITTSNLTAHFVTKSNSAYIDVFSCKDFDANIVIEKVNEYFAPTNISKTFLCRLA